jgi:excisionase family DNA binding protein
MATSPNGVEWKLLDGITDSFYHNFAVDNKKIQGALGGNFIHPDSLGFVYHSHCSAKKGDERFNYSQMIIYKYAAEGKIPALRVGRVWRFDKKAVDTRWWPDRQGLPDDVAEFEAESTAYVVCSQIGLKLPSESYLYRYLRDNDEIPDISFECVMKAAGIIESMGQKRLGPRKRE